MSQFILVHRIIREGNAPTWINVDRIEAMDATHGGENTRLHLGLSGVCVVTESVTAVLDSIRRAEDDR